VVAELLKGRRRSSDQGQMPLPVPRRPRRPRPLGVVVLAAALVVSLSAAGCAPPTSVTFTGRGNGHGRGMGQWGALGYTVDHGWSGTQVLNHFYGGTTMATATPADQRVYLTASGGQELRVVQTYGRLRVDGYSGNLTAVRVARLGAGRFRIWGGSSCTGGWIHITDRTTPQVQVRSGVLQGNDPTRMMQRCTSTGSTRYYRGSMWAVDALGTIVSVNQVATEAMLRSVVAREVSPSWSDLGGGRGAAAVRAQAVAARSYLLAGDTRWRPWATTCDSPASCQVYDGYGTRAAGGTTITRIEDPRTDAGVSTTANQVRVFTGTSRIARTEFSSSTGGWSAGGDFPARVDEGDDYTGNPHRSWSVTIARTTIEARFDARQGRDMGTFQTFDSIVRNGLGADGGRVTSLRARFSGGDVTLTGEQLRSLLGLRSSWFTPSS
jgi:SpoIID/LytB domain protein